jgi:GntR family transcriptional regulator, rspAB operon transcriptional repressor
VFKEQKRLPGENNKDFSYRVIREAIMSLELRPGQEISEIELAQSLQISRTPIREVMAKLREENLVEVIPQVGTYVSKIQLKLIEEAAFMRFTIEKEILRLSCKSFPKDQLLELKKNVAIQEVLLQQEGMERDFHQLDTEFHYMIFKGNNKENVWAAITRLGTHYNRMRVLSEIENRFERAVEQHKKIIAMIENKEADQVEYILNEHVMEPIKLWGKLYNTDSPYINYFDFT